MSLSVRSFIHPGVIGLSTGVNVIARSAISDATTLGERTTALAHMSLAEGIGFTFGPAVQLLSIPLGDKGRRTIGALKESLTLIQERIPTRACEHLRDFVLCFEIYLPFFGRLILNIFNLIQFLIEVNFDDKCMYFATLLCCLA